MPMLTTAAAATLAMALAAATALGIAVSAEDAGSPPASATVSTTALWTIISGTQDLSTLRDFLAFASNGPNATANFTAVLSNTSLPLTLFAPNNAAFNTLVAQLGPLSAADLISNRTAVTELLLTHVVSGTWDSTLLTNGSVLESLQGAQLAVSKTSSGFTDIVAPGSTGRVLVADISGGEQILHIVDEVLLPVAGLVPAPPPPALRTLYQIISTTPDLSTLKALIDVVSDVGPVDLRQALSNATAPVTLFAPSNEAFGALLEALGANASQALISNATAVTEVLLTHVLGSVALGRDLLNKATLHSLQGVNLTVHRNRFFTQIDSPGNAGFVDTFDLRGGLGVMHIIDGVLLPVANVLPPSLYDILTDNGAFQTLKGLVDLASSQGTVDIATALANRSAAITVFAPINSAFDALFDDLGPAGPALFGNATVITGILLEHVLGRAVSTAALTNGSVWTTTLGTNVSVVVTNSSSSGGRNVTAVVSPGATAQIIVPDVYGGLSVAHAVDRVLLPDPLPPPSTDSLYDIISSTSTLSTLKALVDFASLGDVNFVAELSDRAGNFTLFAPVDAAFEVLQVKMGAQAWSALTNNVSAVTSLLLLHAVPYVVNGSKLDNGVVLPSELTGVNLAVKATSSNADIVSPGTTGRVVVYNLRGGAPVAHAISSVLLPAPLPKPPSPPGQSLYGLLGADPTFATLKLLVDVASAGAVNFTALLSNTSQPLTLFAPTNDAVEDYLAEMAITAAALAKNVTAVSNLLLLHVVPSKAYLQADLLKTPMLPTMLGVNLTLSISQGSLNVVAPGSTASVLTFDLLGGKAVAQAVDTVLLAAPLLRRAA